MEADLKAYYAILSGYMDTDAEYNMFKQEVEERKAFGKVIYGIFCLLTLSPKKLPHSHSESLKFGKAFKEVLIAEDTEEDHTDVKKIRRRVMDNMKEMEELNPEPHMNEQLVISFTYTMKAIYSNPEPNLGLRFT